METVSPSSTSSLATAARFWEPRRIPYNAILAAVVVIWIVGTWPHFRGAMNLVDLLRLMVLAALANACYCAAYLVDLAMQRSRFVDTWLRSRWGLWLAGTAFAVLLEWYWIADEIYADFH